MSLNKADRAKINDALTYIGARCYLRVDGFIVTAILSREKMKLHISVYVNGEINGSYQWSGNESKVSEMNEISRRFWCRKTISRPAKELKTFEKILGKREAKKRGIYEKYIFTVPYFSTAGAFITHISKHNESIEVLEYEDYKLALDAWRVVNGEAV